MGQTAGRQPNVIVFFTDQQRWDTTGVHGNPLDLTPNFDRMARRGTHFAHTFTPQPVCGPARSCFQTGQYATQTGCWKNGIPLRPDARTLAHHFNDAGYETGYIGKWHLARRTGRFRRRSAAATAPGSARTPRNGVGCVRRRTVTITTTRASNCPATGWMR